MKAVFADLLNKASRSPFFRKCVDGSLVKAADFYRRHKMPDVQGPEAARWEEARSGLTRDLTVRSGLFRGMKYPGAEAAGSALIPKLLGSYERELHECLERLIAKGYDDVIDVGCAEGYYAVGMALRLPGARVHAYDTSAVARDLCRSMAALNGVEGRVSIQSNCSPETLITFPKPGRTLVICDCEAYEKYLFTPAVRDALRSCDVLIETHDFLGLDISTNLERLFSGSHDLTSILSTDDIQKAKHYQYPELEGLSVPVKFELLREGRPMIMEWLIAETRER